MKRQTVRSRIDVIAHDAIATQIAYEIASRYVDAYLREKSMNGEANYTRGHVQPEY